MVVRQQVDLCLFAEGKRRKSLFVTWKMAVRSLESANERGWVSFKNQRLFFQEAIGLDDILILINILLQEKGTVAAPEYVGVHHVMNVKWEAD